MARTTTTGEPTRVRRSFRLGRSTPLPHRDQTVRGVTPKSASAGYLTSVLLPIRVADTRFVLDQLTELTHGVNPDVDHAALPSQLGRSLDLARIEMFGHSLGGSTTAQAMHDDDRIRAGIDLDGRLWGPWASTVCRALSGCSAPHPERTIRSRLAAVLATQHRTEDPASPRRVAP